MSEVIDWKAEYEKEMARAAEVKERFRAFMIGEAVKDEARAFWSIDPELAAKLADTSGCSFDEEAEVVTGVREAVQQLAAEKPYLFASRIKQGIPPPPSGRGKL